MTKISKKESKHYLQRSVISRMQRRSGNKEINVKRTQKYQKEDT